MENIKQIVSKFDNWNGHKKQLHLSKSRPLFFKEREIWWASIGYNVGDEEDGKNIIFERPVLIIRRFYSNLFLGAPLTSKVKTGNYYFKYKTNNVDGVIILSQVRVYDAKRLLRKIEVVDKDSFKLVTKKLKDLI